MKRMLLAMALSFVILSPTIAEASEPPVDCPKIEMFSDFEQARARFGEEWVLAQTVDIDIESLDRDNRLGEEALNVWGEIMLSAFPDKIHAYVARNEDTSRYLLIVFTFKGAVHGYTCTVNITP